MYTNKDRKLYGVSEQLLSRTTRLTITPRTVTGRLRSNRKLSGSKDRIGKKNNNNIKNSRGERDLLSKFCGGLDRFSGLTSGRTVRIGH